MKRKCTFNDDCAICLSSLSYSSDYFQLKYCEHSFHKTCIEKWAKTCVQRDDLPSCPLCRSVVSLSSLKCLCNKLAEDYLCNQMMFPELSIVIQVKKTRFKLLIEENTFVEQMCNLSDIIAYIRSIVVQMEEDDYAPLQVLLEGRGLVKSVLLIMPRKQEKRLHAMTCILNECVRMYDRMLVEVQCL